MSLIKMTKKSAAAMLVGAVLGLVALRGQARAEANVVASLGMGKPTGEGSDSFSYGPGLALGGAVGLGPQFSLTGTLGYEYLNFNVPELEGFDISASGSIIRILVNPAFHVRANNADFAIGPTLGFFFLSAEASAMGQSAETHVRGYQIGFATSVLFAITPRVALGPYLSYARMWATRTCQKDADGEMCDSSPGNDDEGFLSLGAAARF